jgi:hypothetical protein
MRVPQAVEETLRSWLLRGTDLDGSVDHTLNWWINTVLGFAQGREPPSEEEEEEMRDSLYDLAEEIEQEE